jgi:hypothetical protein
MLQQTSLYYTKSTKEIYILNKKEKYLTTKICMNMANSLTEIKYTKQKTSTLSALEFEIGDLLTDKKYL